MVYQIRSKRVEIKCTRMYVLFFFHAIREVTRCMYFVPCSVNGIEQS
jgi:hypothetical protein